ncbi:15410_t:CDS:2, partial [Racocetra persica]
VVPPYFKTHTEANYTSRKFDPLIIADSDKQSKFLDERRSSESLLIIDTIKSENDGFEAKKDKYNVSVYPKSIDTLNANENFKL